MKCKFCDAELEQDNPVCPQCGRDNAAMPQSEIAQDAPCPESEMPELETLELEATEPEAPEDEPTAQPAVTQEPEKQPMGRRKKIMLMVFCGCLLLGIAAAVYYHVNGGFRKRENNVYYKDSYTVKDQKAADAADTVVATIGDWQLTNGELQVYYWMQVYDFLDGYNYTQYGLNYKQPLDSQQCGVADGTWQQFFLTSALECWHSYQGLSDMAEKNGLELDKEQLETLQTLRQRTEETAKQMGFDSVDALVQSNMGAGCDFDDYAYYMERYYYGYLYFNEQYEKMTPADAEVEAYFTEHAQKYASGQITKDSGDFVDVRHILLEPEGGTKSEDGKTVTYSDAEWEACRVKAQELLDKWLAGAHTEESFAQLATEHSTDPGSKTRGGLYERVSKGDMVQAFEDWCFDESRKTGDSGLVKTPYGYHIMYFVDSEPKYMTYARADLLQEKTTQMVNEIKEAYPMDVDYKKIVLAEVALG